MESKSLVAEETRRITNIIKEELGINNEVSKLAYIVTNAIITNDDDMQCYNVTIADDNRWKILVEVKERQKYDKDYLGVTYFSERKILFSIYRVNGKIKPNKLMEVVSHEILHAFNISTSKKDGFIKSETNKNLYVKAATEARNGATDLNRYVGYVIYLSNRFEANAFENGLYSYLMSCNLQFIGEEEDAMQESMFYKRLIILRKANKAIKEFPNDAKRIAETTYGKTYEWIKKLSDSALKNCRRQIGRALIKFRNYYDWSHGGNSNITI